MTFDAARLANAATAKLRAYDPGHDLPALRQRFGAALAELGSNENPLGPSPLALRAIADSVGDAFRYPDPNGGALKSALARHLGVEIDRLTLSNGSHELLMLIAQTFADASTSIVHSQFGFAVFPIATAAVGARAIVVPSLPIDHASAPRGHDLDAMAAAIASDTRIVYLANPNNPTGTWFGDAALETFLARVPPHVIVVADEAYHEYVDASGLSSALRFADRHPNLLVTRTFSKAYALAGLRIGYGIGHPSTIGVIERLRESFNVNAFALAAAAASLDDGAHLARVRAVNARDRAEMTAQLSSIGLRTLPSQTNFVLVDFERDAAPIERALMERGVVVRPMGGYGLGTCLRVSVGAPSENARLIDALREIVGAGV